MDWFKICIIGILIFSGFMNLFYMREGYQPKKSKPQVYALALLLDVLLSLGVWFWL